MLTQHWTLKSRVKCLMERIPFSNWCRTNVPSHVVFHVVQSANFSTCHSAEKGGLIHGGDGSSRLSGDLCLSGQCLEGFSQHLNHLLLSSLKWNNIPFSPLTICLWPHFWPPSLLSPGSSFYFTSIRAILFLARVSFRSTPAVFCQCGGPTLTDRHRAYETGSVTPPCASPWPRFPLQWGDKWLWAFTLWDLRH